MPQNGIYHVGVTALADAFAHNPGMRIINLSDNTLTKKGATAIANVSYCFLERVCGWDQIDLWPMA